MAKASPSYTVADRSHAENSSHGRDVSLVEEIPETSENLTHYGVAVVCLHFPFFKDGARYLLLVLHLTLFLATSGP